MSSKKEEKAQAVAERIKVAGLTTAKGLSRVQAERAATTAARNVNAYGQKEEDPCRWQEMGADVSGRPSIQEDHGA
uniref:Uncharacterized protein n=1 Tax=Vitis vinifera TaxID=29760 RepID=F6H7V2_VITVI